MANFVKLMQGVIVVDIEIEKREASCEIDESGSIIMSALSGIKETVKSERKRTRQTQEGTECAALSFGTAQ